MRPRHTWPISRVLAIAFCLLIILSVGGMTAFSLSTLQQATQDQISKRASQDIEATVERLRDQLQPARNQVERIAKLLSDKRLYPDEKSQLTDVLQGALVATPHINAVLVVEPDFRALIALQEQPSDASVIFSNEENNPVIRRAMTQARTSDEAFWGTPIYVPEVGTLINVVKAFRIDGEFAGFVASTVKVTELSAQMANRRSEITTGTFILWNSDRMLAHAKMTDPHGFGISQDKPLPLVADVGDPVVTAFVGNQFMVTDLFSPETYPNLKVIELPGRDWPYIIAYRDIQEFGQPVWTVGVYVNGEAFNAERWLLTTVGLAGGGVLILGIIAALWLGMRISRPVQLLAETAEQIAVQDPEHIEPMRPSRIRELDQASDAFNRMIAGLKDRAFLRATFGKYVPESVASQILENRTFVQEPRLRNATVMFTDIAGFTTLCENLTPAQTIEVLNDYFSAVVEPIEANGGVIQQYQGDAMLATFNIPTDRPGHADDAVKAAIRIEQILSERTFGPGIPIKTRIGINTGDIVGGTVGAGGRLGYTVHGDPVNIAARLEVMNKDLGTLVLISDATRRQITIPVEFEMMGELGIRGKQHTVTVYSILKHQLSHQQETAGDDQ
ncbi:HAMP domain-containing protein [Alphaproteobacteria bacterium HT1-32]|nr:HAMP domain-containing protein [Alphaproteobacteria bacterium HT1-32]